MYSQIVQQSKTKYNFFSIFVSFFQELNSDNLGTISAYVTVPYNEYNDGINTKDSSMVVIGEVVAAPVIPHSYFNIRTSDTYITIQGINFHTDSDVTVLSHVGESNVHPIVGLTYPIDTTSFRVEVSSMNFLFD